MREEIILSIEQACEIEYGTRVVRKRDAGKGYPVYGGGGATFEMDEFNREDRIVIARFGMSEKCTRFVTDKFFLNDSGLTLSPKEISLSQRFLDFQILSLNDKIYAMGKGTAQKNLDVSTFRKLEIFVPPLVEQERIVSILDKAFEGIDKAIAQTEQNLASARELFESYLNNIFTQKGDDWVEKKLGEVCSITSSLVDPKEKQYQDLYHIGAGNMISNSKELVDVLMAKEEGLKSGKHTFTTDMVLYSKIRPYLMKVSVPDFEGLCSADVYPLMPNVDLVKREYLFYLLLTKNFTDYAISRSARAGMPKINRTCLFSYEASYPTLTEQNTILYRLNALSNQTKQLQALYTQKLNDLKELKQSLLQQAFAGELTKEDAA